MKVAVLDLGTNTFHLMIASVHSDGSWKKILHRKVTVKLGQGGIHQNRIAPVPFRRGIAAIAGFKKIIEHHQVKTVRAFGTAALRNASNGGEFLDDARENFGITIALISGSDEASLIYSGVRRAVDLGDDFSLIMDIGGGSTEFIIANNRKIFWKQSFKIGASMLLEKFQPADPIRKGELKLIEHYLDDVLKPLRAALMKFPAARLIGSAGSFETVTSMIRYRNPAAGSHYGKTSHPIKRSELNALHRDIIRSTTAERKKMKGLISMRVDMIVPASILLNFVLKQTGIKNILLSTYSLKEGALDQIVNSESVLIHAKGKRSAT